MARPIRINIEGGYYHVINRGRNKMKIFRHEKDYKEFLRLLGESCEQYQVSILAYCLMSNHYHLLICTSHANLPEFMRQLNGVYTQIFNRKYHSDGSLFRGRYKSIIVQEELYLMRVIRYIHLNPNKAGLAKKLGDYKFSSHNDYMNNSSNYLWLKINDIISREWVVGKRGIAAYKKFMLQKDDEELEDFYKCTKRAYILGEKDYFDKIHQIYIHGKRYFDREVPEEWKIKQKKIVISIEQRVLKEYGIKREELFCSIRGKDNEARKVAIKLIRDKTGISCKEIAKRYCVGNPRSISEYGRRVRMKRMSDKEFDRRYQRIDTSLQVET